MVRQPEVNPHRAAPRQCNNCGTTHVEFRSEVMQWDSGDLSLIKGVMLQGEVARGHANQRSSRVLRHMR